MGAPIFLSQVVAIGRQEEDDFTTRQKKVFLVSMGLIMSLGGLVWGALCFFNDLMVPAMIPFGYVVITLVNFSLFHWFKRYAITKSIQVFFSLSLPFLFQWLLGGFAATGAVMVWAVLPLIGSLAFEETRYSRVWLVTFLLFTIASGWLDPMVSERAIDVGDGMRALFFTINILAVAATVYSLTVYFIDIRDIANKSINEKHNALVKSQSSLIQSEKMAVLGRLIAGVAHELNTPLGAIRASIGNVNSASSGMFERLPVLLDKMPTEHKTAFVDMGAAVLKAETLLSSREERKAKKVLVGQLEARGVENAFDAAGLLVDAGITEVAPSWVPLLNSEWAGEALEILFNLSEQYRNGQNIEMAADKAAKIIFALKSYSHIDQGEEMKKADICQSIDNVLMLYHNQLKKGIDVVRDFEDRPEILCRIDELSQVWTNLLHNAIQAMGGNGTLTVKVRSTGTKVVVSFTDTGVGVPENIQDKIFDPFFTTKPLGEGSGLGLDISRKMVRNHKGSIRVESVPGKTTFKIRLPVHS